MEDQGVLNKDFAVPEENGYELIGEYPWDMEENEQPDYEWMWEDICQIMEEPIQKMITKKKLEIRCYVSNFGWQKRTGEIFIPPNCTEPASILRKCLPQTDNSFRIFWNEKEKTIKINNCHHDSPVWGVEWYTIRRLEK